MLAFMLYKCPMNMACSRTHGDGISMANSPVLCAFERSTVRHQKQKVVPFAGNSRTLCTIVWFGREANAKFSASCQGTLTRTRNAIPMAHRPNTEINCQVSLNHASNFLSLVNLLNPRIEALLMAGFCSFLLFRSSEAYVGDPYVQMSALCV